MSYSGDGKCTKALPHERLFFCAFVVVRYSMFEHCRDAEVALLSYIIVSLKASKRNFLLHW